MSDAADKRKLLQRVGVVFSVMLLLLVGLAAFELRGGTDPGEAVPTQPDRRAGGKVAQPVQEVRGSISPARTGTDLEAGQDAPGAEPVTSPACPPVPAAPVCPPVPPPVVKYLPAPQPAEPAGHNKHVAPPAQGKGYMLQLGESGGVDGAERLQEALRAKGYPAYVEGRVLLGPYKSAKEANAARARLLLQGQQSAVLVPPKPRK